MAVFVLIVAVSVIGTVTHQSHRSGRPWKLSTPQEMCIVPCRWCDESWENVGRVFYLAE